MDIVFLIFYFTILLVPSVFGLHRYYLVYLFYKSKKQKRNLVAYNELQEVPVVTVQLPIFNERYVAPRLIKTVCEFDYPKEKLDIQVLDDSNDETVGIVAHQVEYYRSLGFDIHHIRRSNREGFKAGALNYGLQTAKGEFVAIFDADFLPATDFLKQMVPQFYSAEKVGMVQARWEHLNRDYSLLTQAQSMLLDGHFVIEHTARNRSGAFFNFNGTAGVWRKVCIEDAGGWSGDTLTEDIDLSYRAQMKGWNFIYREDVIAPAELPVDMNALKTQQHRWAKGSIQVARKLLPAILKSSLPFRVKMEAFFHLAANINYLLITLTSFLMPISLYVRHMNGWDNFLWIDLPFFFSATWSVSVFYYHSQKVVHRDFWSRIKYIPFSLAVGIGLCVNNTRAVLEGFSNKPSEFKRTPKFAVVQKGDSWKDKSYKSRLNWTSVVEFMLTVHFSIAMTYAVIEELYFSLPFVALFEIGFLYTTFLSIHQSRFVQKILSESREVAAQIS